MTQAAQTNTTKRLSSLFTDPMVAEAFRRAERDCPPSPVEAGRPAPVLVGGNAVRALELV
jgi:hypothetical protein